MLAHAKRSVKLSLGLAMLMSLLGACSDGGGTTTQQAGPSKQEVFDAFVNRLGGASFGNAATIDQMQNFQCEKAVGEPGFNCVFDIPGHEVSHFRYNAIKKDDGTWGLY